MIRTLPRHWFCLIHKKTQKSNINQHVLANYVQVAKGSNYAKRSQNIDFSLESQQLRSIYPSVVEEILNELLFYHKNRPDLRQSYNYMFDYTCYVKDLYLPDSLFCIHAYKFFEKSSLLTEENLKKVYILAWCVRFLSASLIIVDDILDKSTLRYNKTPWYKSPGVGVDNAICDSALIQTSVTFLLLNHFSSHPQLKGIQKELVINYATALVSEKIDIKPLKLHEFENNQEYVKAYPATVPYVLCAMYLANVDDPRLLSIAREFLIELSIFVKIEKLTLIIIASHLSLAQFTFSEYADMQLKFGLASGISSDKEDSMINAFQTQLYSFVEHFFKLIAAYGQQDDVECVFVQTEKDCTDISEGKNTWLAIQAQKQGNEIQRNILREHYGKDNTQSIFKVYQVFKELGLEKQFSKYKEDFYEIMFERIQRLPKKLPTQFFLDMLDYAMMGGMRY